MTNFFDTDTAGEAIEAVNPAVEATSAEYLGRWSRLVSTTNWEKGRIITAWRRSLIEAGAPPASCGDEAWSRRVGNVSSQHVGRLRRVFERFGEVHPQYAGLYWSHFHAALDWDDAEMWLEGAVESGWSVAQMRHQRWEALGAPDQLKPLPSEIITAELDEDAPSPGDSLPGEVSATTGVVHEADQSEAGGDAEPAGCEALAEPFAPGEAAPAVAPLRPFENLPVLPQDLAEAFESFKLAILNHKVSGWQAISCDEVLSVLDALKALAQAPAAG